MVTASTLISKLLALHVESLGATVDTVAKTTTVTTALASEVSIGVVNLQ